VRGRAVEHVRDEVRGSETRLHNGHREIEEQCPTRGVAREVLVGRAQEPRKRALLHGNRERRLRLPRPREARLEDLHFSRLIEWYRDSVLRTSIGLNIFEHPTG
jgi:hypothetical protein